MPLPLSIFTICFQEIEFIERSVRASLQQAERVVVVEGATNKESEHLGRGIRIANSPSSTDGTVDVLRALEREFGYDRLRVFYAQDRYWRNKTEMVQQAAGHCHHGLLMQRDVDEFWFDRQITTLRSIMEEGGYSDVEFHCRHFWSGPDYFCSIGNGWGGGDPWRRAWTWYGEPVLSHEPPLFHLRWENLLEKEDTLSVGLVFYHYSYCHMPRVLRKERFYGLRPRQLVEPMIEWRRKQLDAPCGPLTKFTGEHPIDVTWMEIAQ